MKTEKVVEEAPFNIEDIYVDVAAIEEGRWVPLGAEFPGVEILARGLSSKPAQKYQEMLERTTPRNKRLTNGRLTAEATDEILTKTLVEKCVFDWRGIAQDGAVLPFSKEKLQEFMTQPRLRRFKIGVINAITDLETKKTEAEEALTKN